MSGIDIGTTLAIATGLPATFTEAGYEAMTWVNIVGLVSIGELGDDNEAITVPDLTAGRIRTLKGAATGTTVAVALRAPIAGEVITGQTNVRAAAAATTGAEYSFRITDASGNSEYVSGVVMSFKRTERTTSSYEGYTFSVTANYPIVTGT